MSDIRLRSTNWGTTRQQLTAHQTRSNLLILKVVFNFIKLLLEKTAGCAEIKGLDLVERDTHDVEGLSVRRFCSYRSRQVHGDLGAGAAARILAARQGP